MDDARPSGRSKPFRRNEDLEQLLEMLNAALAPADKLMLECEALCDNRHPVVFIMGPLRSGTTLFMQWLASTGVFAYPTNLMSRFYGAPLVGARIQQLLTDQKYNFRNEILDFNSSVDFVSENGKTTGALAPNEFWYFWRRFLPFGELDWLSDETLFSKVDKVGLVEELTSLTRIFGKPFALKGMILNYNIAFLDRIFDDAIFIQLKRDPVANVASILGARERQYGEDKTWYSFKIPEYPELVKMDTLHQCVGQQHYISQAVTHGIAAVDDSRKLVVDYEVFCDNPAGTYEELMSKLNVPLDQQAYAGPDSFAVSRSVDVDQRAQIERVLAKFNS